MGLLSAIVLSGGGTGGGVGFIIVVAEPGESRDLGINDVVGGLVYASTIV